MTFRSSASLEVLKARAELLKRVRAFFDQRGFFEVQTPVLSSDTVVDRHLDPIHVDLPDQAAAGDAQRGRWLQTSPEFAMKRLLASGAEAIYQVGPAFRWGEAGAMHNPEFTMLEWYRCGDTDAEAMRLLGELASLALDLPAHRVLSVRDACQQHAQIDAFVATAEELRSHMADRNIPFPATLSVDDWDSWFDLLFATMVQPHLGQSVPEIVCDYPASQSALARIREGDPPVAERFELFVHGVELANGYHELLDAEELVQRNRRVNAQRIQDGKSPLPEDSRLLEAMRSGLPACAGVALGFDRLVMLAVEAEDIREVLAFPWNQA